MDTLVVANPSQMDIEELAASLGADLNQGLTSSDASQRLADHGPNELRAASPVPTWRKVLRQFRDPLIYLLLGAVLVSLIVWLFEGRVGLPVDALVIATVVVVTPSWVICRRRVLSELSRRCSRWRPSHQPSSGTARPCECRAGSWLSATCSPWVRAMPWGPMLA